MIFRTAGNRENPAVLFFHAMGVTGESSRPVAEYINSIDRAGAGTAEFMTHTIRYYCGKT